MKYKKLLFILFLAATISGCSSTPVPSERHDNLCRIFAHDSEWKTASKETYRKWGLPPWTQLAIVKQESSFKPDARPGMEYFLFIPTGRKSSARGFTQALDGTWTEYKRETGNSWADRDDISDSLDFIGWYTHKASKRTGLSKRNAYQVYLAYHEGAGGYLRETYNKKPWLKKVARKVQNQAVDYMKEYKRCS